MKYINRENMETVKKTNREILVFRNTAIDYLNKNSKETKLAYALKRVVDKTEKHIEKWTQDRIDIQLNNAKEDADGCVIYEDLPSGQRKYKFDKAGLRSLDKEYLELLDKESDVCIYIGTELPKEFDSSLYLEVWGGFVLKEEKMAKSIAM